MQKPQFLKNNDLVTIVSPGGKIDADKILNAVKWLNSWGLEVKLGKNCLNNWHNFAGTDHERLEDLQEALNNPEIKAIFCSRGGYGMVRLIDQLNFSEFIKHPKWLIGFSDITFLHSCLNNRYHFASMHGPMPVKFPDFPKSDASMLYLKNSLFGINSIYEITASENNVTGSAEGILFGGNLSVLTHLNGSSFDYDPAGKILFLEDIDEYLYQIDRMLWALEQSHDLSMLKGLIVGQFTSVKDNDTPFGFNLKQIFISHFEKFGFPVCFDFPAGHEDENYPLIFGSHYQLDVSRKTTTIKEY